MPDTSLLPEWYARVAADRLESLTIYGSADDLAAARFGPDNRSSALFAGFLFDRVELARDLDLPEMGSDIDFLIAAWNRWQSDLFDHLDGNYLAAIWDAQENRLTLGRDAMGFYPLYYSIHQGDLWWSPNVLALAHSGQIPRKANRQSLALRLVNSTPTQGETFFEGVNRLPAGHTLRWQPRREPEVVLYWDPLPSDDEPWLPADQAFEEFEPRLQSAVDRCLQLSPNGITFSGGLDSSAIAALATASTASHERPTLTAYSAVAPSGYSGDDGEPWQKPVTELLGLPHRAGDARQRLGHRTLMEANLEEIPHLPAPTMVWWVGAFLGFYRSISQDGGRVLLTGNGGDDWLGIPEWWTADLLRSGRLWTILRFFRSSIGTGGRSWQYATQELLWRRGFRTLADTQWARLAPEHRNRIARQRLDSSIPSWVCPQREDRQELLETLLSRRASPLDSRGKSPSSMLRHLNRQAMASPFVSYERERNFHEERRVGLLLLHPFLDRRWIEFVSRISPESHLLGGHYKGLLRPILERHLPGLGIASQQKGYPARGRDFLTERLAEDLLTCWPSLDFRELTESCLIDSGEVQKIIPRSTTPHAQRVLLFTLLSTETWLRHHS